VQKVQPSSSPKWVAKRVFVQVFTMLNSMNELKFNGHWYYLKRWWASIFFREYKEWHQQKQQFTTKHPENKHNYTLKHVNKLHYLIKCDHTIDQTHNLFVYQPMNIQMSQ
jgi:hypothetical protein